MLRISIYSLFSNSWVSEKQSTGRRSEDGGMAYTGPMQRQEDQDTTWTQEEGDMKKVYFRLSLCFWFLLLSSALLINLPSTRHLYMTPVQVDFPLRLFIASHFFVKSMNLTCSGWIKIGHHPTPTPLCFSATISSST